MDRSRFRIAVRCRPLVRTERKSGTKWADFNCNKDDGKITVDGTVFDFDYIFDYRDDRDVVYNESVKRLVTDVMQGGHSIAILAYGQTNSGKTYTMGLDYNLHMQRESLDNNEGIVPRVLHDILIECSNSDESCTEVKVSFLEVYNEKIYDLLSKELDRKPLVMMEEFNKPKDIIEMKVASFDEALQALVDGSLKRSTASSSNNIQSSRSHAAFTVHIKKKMGSDESISEIMLVDLAGSEAPSKMGSVGETFHTGCRINTSLMALHGVVRALQTKTRNGHIPYRNSTLTRILKPYLEGNSEALMIACITPSNDCLSDSLATLRFVESMKQIGYNPNETATVRKRLYDTPWKSSKKVNVGPRSSASVLPQPQLTKTPFVQRSLIMPSSIAVELYKNDTITETSIPQDVPVKKPESQVFSSSFPTELKLTRDGKLRLHTPDAKLLATFNKEFRKYRKSAIQDRHNVCARLILSDSTNLIGGSPSSSSEDSDGFNMQPLLPEPSPTVDDPKPAVKVLRRSVRLSVLPQQNYNVSNFVKSQKMHRNKVESTKEKENDDNLQPRPIRNKGKCVRQNNKVRSDDENCNLILGILNSCNFKMLQSLPCIGPTYSMVICNWVKTKGKLNTISDLKNVSSLPKTFYTRFTKANHCK